MVGRPNSRNAYQRLAYALRVASKKRGGLGGDTYDGDFILGVIHDWFVKEENETGVRWVLTSTGLRRMRV